MLSWWEERSFGHWDHVVVGAGIVGLSAALALRDRHPTASILVLERGVLPTGASTRNAGFACFGSLTELLEDVTRHGTLRAVALVARRHAGLRHLLERVGPDAAGYRPCGGWELLPADQAHALDAIDALEEALRPVLGPGALVRADERLPGFGFGDTAHLVGMPYEGSVDPGRLMRALLAKAAAADIPVWTGARVEALEPDGTGVDVHLDALSLRAGAVAVCTNAFVRDLLPDLTVRPGRGQVLVTEPVPGLPFEGVFHLDQGYVYFRDVEGRVLLGGGRNLDVDGETTTDLDVTPGIQTYLEDLLRRVVVPGRDVRIARRWAGVMGFGDDKAPIVQRVGAHMAVGVRLGGMGVALGSHVGEEVAGLLN